MYYQGANLQEEEGYGSGQPLVLMHGGGSSIPVSFGQGIPALAKHFKVIAFDEQNHGRHGLTRAL